MSNQNKFMGPFFGLYSTTVRNKLSELSKSSYNKYLVLSHGNLMRTSFRVPNKTAIIFVAPEYAVLSKNYAFKTMKQPIFTNSNSLNSFLKFRLPEPMYATLTGNKSHYVNIHDSGSLIADMRLTFRDVHNDDKVGVYELPISRSSVYYKPIKTEIKLSEFLKDKGEGIYFIFACRSETCPLGRVYTVNMTGGGRILAPIRPVPAEGQTRLTGLPGNLRGALPSIKSRNQVRQPRANIPPAVRNAFANLMKRKKENAAKASKVKTARRLTIKPSSKTVTKRTVTKPRSTTATKRTVSKTKRYITARRTARRKAVDNVSKEISRLLKNPPTQARLNKIYIQLAKLTNIEGKNEVVF